MVYWLYQLCFPTQRLLLLDRGWQEKPVSKPLSLFSCFPAKETLACQAARQHTTEILPHIASFFLFSRQELKRWVADFQWRRGEIMLSTAIATSLSFTLERDGALH